MKKSPTSAPLSPPTAAHRAERFLTVPQWRRLLAAARRRGPRDEALLLVMYEGGLRRAEPGLLRLSYAARLNRRQLYVWRGKGSLSTWIDLSDVTTKALLAWIRLCYPDPAAREPEQFVFPGRGGHGISPRGVYFIFNEISREAGLQAAVTSPHALKRSRVQHLLEAALEQGVPTERLYRSLAQLVGHKNVATTLGHYTTQTKREKQMVNELTNLFVGKEKPST